MKITSQAFENGATIPDKYTMYRSASTGWMSRVADNVLYTVRQPPKARAQPATAEKQGP